MNFITIAILGYFLLAFEGVASKFLITGRIKSWPVYVFYMGIFSIFSFLLFPFGGQWVGWEIFGQLFFSGALLFLSLVFLFQSLIDSAASRVYVLFGAIATLSTILLGIIAGEKLNVLPLLGILLLAIGGFFISFKFYKKKFFHNYKKVILAGILFGCSTMILKQGFNEVNFISGYVFSRVGLAVMAILILVAPSFRNEIKNKISNKKKRNLFNFCLVFGVKALAGAGSFLTVYAISLGSVVIVNALASIQYLFTFFLTTMMAFFFKKEMQEQMSLSNLVFKGIGLGLIILGVVLLNL